MQTLLISTAQTPAFLALAEDNNITQLIELPSVRSSAAVFSALQKLNAKPQRIAVDVGPGSFTQVRVGVVVANALGKAWQVPLSEAAYTSTPAELLAQAQPVELAKPLYLYPPHITTPKPL